MTMHRASVRLLAGVVFLASLVIAGFAEEAKEAPTTKEPVGSRDNARTESGWATVAPDDIRLLKEQIARQQQQIEELLRMMKQLRARIDGGDRGEQARSEPAPGAGLVASAGPLIPSASTTAAGAPAALTAVARPQGNGGAASAPEDMQVLKGELEAVANSAAQANQRLAKLESNFADTQKRTAAQFKGLGNFNFSGDVRLRYEPFFQEGAPDRHRERIRARLNITGKLTDEVSGGIAVASNALEDVNSTNQTLTGFFTRKTIGFDRYFISYKPRAFKPLSLTVGKFVYPWYRTPLTFDNDLNPEGFAQVLAFDLKSPVFKNVTLVGFQLPFNEATGSHDSFIYGGQLQTRWKLNDKVNLALYAAGINFSRADPIAVAIAAGTLRPSLPNSNTFRTDANGNVLGYASKFAYLDLIGVVDYRWNPRWPMTLTFHFVNNTRAATRERQAYWGEVTFGQLRETKDVQFGYSLIRIEKDAVIGAFNESDLRSATNVRNHRVQFGYQSFSNVSMEWTMWLGRLADPFQNTSLVPSGIRSACTTAPFTDCHDSLLNRMQFDVTYKF